MPPKPIASAGCDTILFLCKKLIFNSKYTPKLEYHVLFLKKISRGNIYMPPKPLAMNHRAALSLFHR